MKAAAMFVLGLALCGRVSGATTISFGEISAGTEVTNQYQGVAISGGAVVGSGDGASLKNENGQTVRLAFTSLQNSISANYISSQGLLVSAYGASGNLVSLIAYGSSPGQGSLFNVSGTGIASVAITSLAGGDFKLDNITYTYTAPSPVAAPPTAQTPEPASLLLLGTGLFGAAALCIYRSAMAKRGAGIGEAGGEIAV